MSPADRAAREQDPGIDPHFVGRLGAVVTITENLVRSCSTPRRSASRRSSRPTWSGSTKETITQEGNPDLRPEEISTTDLQVYYGSDRVNAAVTLFDSRQSNVIAETESFDLIQNFDRFQTRGIEVEARVRPLRNVELTSAMTYQKLKNDDSIRRPRDPCAPVHGKVRDLVSDGHPV